MHPAFIAFGVPLLFVLCGAMGKKLVRGQGWDRKDFYLGTQLTLAAFSADILFVIELLRREHDNTGQTAVHYQEITAVGFAPLCLALYTFLLCLHQDWEHQTEQRTGQIWRLVILSNLVGTLLFAAFVFLVKGVR